MATMIWAAALATGLFAGCIGSTDPILLVHNEGADPLEVAVAVRDPSSLKAVYSHVFFVAPSGADEVEVDLDGTYNVTAFTPSGLRGARDLEFWHGNLLGGQMYATVWLEEGRLWVREDHAD